MPKPNMTTSAWLELEQIVSRFEAALHDQQRPRIRDYLSARETDPVILLIELIAAEAEHRWRRGQSATACEYISTFADLLVEAKDRERLAEALGEVQQTMSLGHSQSHSSFAPANEEQRPSDAKRLGRYQMIEPISQTPKAKDDRRPLTP